MMNGRNNGKKIMAVRIVQHAFEIIHLVTEQNPIQVLGASFFYLFAQNAADQYSCLWSPPYYSTIVPCNLSPPF